MGFGSLQRNQTRRSLRRFTSPSPSTLRVSHPHSGLIPPGPCGFVSRHIRPWDSAFDVFPTRSAVTPFDVRCSRAVSAGGHPPLPRLRSVTPTERPFTLPPRLSDCRGRYAHDLSPLRGHTNSAVELSLSPHALACAVLRGLDPTEPEDDCKSHPSLRGLPPSCLKHHQQ